MQVDVWLMRIVATSGDIWYLNAKVASRRNSQMMLTAVLHCRFDSDACLTAGVVYDTILLLVGNSFDFLNGEIFEAQRIEHHRFRQRTAFGR